MDMMGMMLKSFGVDPAMIVEQATQLGATFERLTHQLERIETNQLTMMAAMGLYVPPPEGAVAQLIADESRRIIDANAA